MWAGAWPVLLKLPLMGRSTRCLFFILATALCCQLLCEAVYVNPHSQIINPRTVLQN